MLTIQDVSKAVPANLKNSVTQDLVNKINTVVEDDIVAEQVRDNFLSYANVLADGKYKMQDYLSAVLYVSYKLMNMKNEDAYAKTFPERYASLVQAGRTTKEISAYTSAYANGKMVNAMLEQSFIPTWVLNRDVHQSAINKLRDLMLNAESEKVQCEAATALVTQLGKPKDSNFQINMNLTESSGMNEMNATLLRMAEQQQEILRLGGATTKEIAGSRIYEGEKV